MNAYTKYKFLDVWIVQGVWDHMVQVGQAAGLAPGKAITMTDTLVGLRGWDHKPIDFCIPVEPSVATERDIRRMMVAHKVRGYEVKRADPPSSTDLLAWDDEIGAALLQSLGDMNDANIAPVGNDTASSALSALAVKEADKEYERHWGTGTNVGFMKQLLTETSSSLAQDAVSQTPRRSARDKKRKPLGVPAISSGRTNKRVKRRA